MFGPHHGFGPHHHVMMGPHHMGLGIGVVVPPPPPRAVIVADPFYGPPRPVYGYGPRYYDDGEVVCCCNIF